MHEQRGVPVVESLCDRLKTPSSVKKAGMTASESHLKVHRALDMKATSLVRLFNELAIKNKPEQLEDLILISEADSRGRTGLENRKYPQANYLREMAKASLDIDVKSVVDQCDGDGQKIKQRLYQASVAAVKRKMGRPKDREMEYSI